MLDIDIDRVGQLDYNIIVMGTNDLPTSREVLISLIYTLQMLLLMFLFNNKIYAYILIFSHELYY